jgi:hypothetical protein
MLIMIKQGLIEELVEEILEALEALEEYWVKEYEENYLSD